MIELELTYLAKFLPPDFDQLEKKEILDIYLPRAVDHPTLRVRKNGGKYEITKKQPVKDGDSSQQLEQTIPLTKVEFDELDSLDGKRVRKIRHFLPWNGQTAEVDVFMDELRGLVLVDFEFESVDQKAEFKMPEFCLAEVTQEHFIAGGMLCGKSYRDIEKELAKHHYRPINLTH